MELTHQAEVAAQIFRFVKGHKDEKLSEEKISEGTAIDQRTVYKVLELFQDLGLVRLKPSLLDELLFQYIPDTEWNPGTKKVASLLEAFDVASSKLIVTE